MPVAVRTPVPIPAAPRIKSNEPDWLQHLRTEGKSLADSAFLPSIESHLPFPSPTSVYSCFSISPVPLSGQSI